MEQLDIFEYKILIREHKFIAKELVYKLYPKNQNKFTIYKLIEMAKNNFFIPYSFNDNFQYYTILLDNLQNWFSIILTSEEKEILKFYCLQRENFNRDILQNIDLNIFFNYNPSDQYLRYFQLNVQYEILLLYSQLVDVSEEYFTKFKEIFYIIKKEEEEYIDLSKKIGDLFHV